MAEQTGDVLEHITAWWHGTPYEEGRCAGPFETKQAAISAGVAEEYGKRFWIGKCSQTLVLSDQVDGDSFLEWIDESFANGEVLADGDDGPFFEAGKEQMADLQARLRATCDEWQRAHGIRFGCMTLIPIEECWVDGTTGEEVASEQPTA